MSDGRAIFGLSPPLAKLPQTATCTVEGTNINCSTTFSDCAKVDLQGQPGTTVWSCVPQGETNARAAVPVAVAPTQNAVAPPSSQGGWASGNQGWIWGGIILLIIIIIIIAIAARGNKKTIAIAPAAVAPIQVVQ